jgi:hypothetical protein
MGPFLFPVVAFFLWEFPSMVAMSLHKLFCAMTDRSLQEQFLGIWAYRILGMMVFWPAVMITGGVAAGTGVGAGFGRFLLAVEGLITVVVLLWARISERGA